MTFWSTAKATQITLATFGNCSEHSQKQLTVCQVGKVFICNCPSGVSGTRYL